MLEQNLAYLVERRALLHGDDTAIVEADTGARYTYREIVDRSCRLANALGAAGIGKGDRVCCLTQNSVEYVDLFLAAARLGAVICPMNYRLSAREIEAIVEDAVPRAFVFDAEFADLVRSVLDRQPVEAVFAFGKGRPAWARDLAAERERQAAAGAGIAGDSEDALLMLFTAGSTGRAKGVMLRHRNLFFSCTNWIIELGISRADFTLTVLPLFHIGGHILWTLPHLMIGARVLLLRRFDPRATLELLARERITNTYLIPAMAKMVLALPDWKRHDLGSVRFIGSGGEAVSESITTAFAGMGVPILNSYGLTETSDGTTSIRPYDAQGKAANCIGKPLPFVEARIVDDHGVELPAGEAGEIVHRGPTVAEGYWHRPQESARAFRDGWLHSGDIGMRDDEGYLHFLGRRDDMIVTGGENVYPAEVEQAILGHPAIVDAAVLGVADDKWGQLVKAIVATRHGERVDRDALDRHLATRLSTFKRPRVYEFVDQLPKIGSGKLDRASIRRTYGSSASD